MVGSLRVRVNPGLRNRLGWGERCGDAGLHRLGSLGMVEVMHRLSTPCAQVMHRLCTFGRVGMLWLERNGSPLVLICGDRGVKKWGQKRLVAYVEEGPWNVL